MFDSTTLPDSAVELADLHDQIVQKLGSVRLTGLTDDEALHVAASLERTNRRQVGVDVRIFTEVTDRGAHRKVGCLTPRAWLDNWLRLGAGAGKRRWEAAAAIAHLNAFSGEPLPPALPATAAAVADGDLSIDHIAEITAVMSHIPNVIADEVRADAEAQLAHAGRELTPQQLRTVGNRLLAHLDPDGELTDQYDRARTRGFAVQPQDRRLMSKVRASLTPNLRAKLDALLVLWAAPGMNNPEDPKSPSGPATSADPAALGAARDRDSRSQTQRNHDALEAMATALIANDGLGNSQTLPAHLVITASVRDLERGDGIATTATGTRVPVRNLVELAADATPWLQIFANHTSSVLYFGRGGRLASLPQRLALFGRDRGCTAPGCTRSFIATQAHHLPDWQDGGVTNIDHLGAACGGHNRIVGKNIGDWETEIIDKGPHTGRVGWRPTGSNQPWQVNHAHQPERILRENGPAEPGNPAAHRKRTA